jgi:hypothetical protein
VHLVALDLDVGHYCDPGVVINLVDLVNLRNVLRRDVQSRLELPVASLVF